MLLSNSNTYNNKSAIQIYHKKNRNMYIYISNFLSIYKLKSGRKCQSTCHFRMHVFVYADNSWFKKIEEPVTTVHITF